MENRVKVGVRIRPLVQKELDEGTDISVKAEGDKRIHIQIPARSNKFEFDWVFGPQVKQSTIYEQIAAH